MPPRGGTGDSTVSQAYLFDQERLQDWGGSSRKINAHGTGIPYHEVEALARVLLPEIQAFFESAGRAAGVCRAESTARK